MKKKTVALEVVTQQFFSFGNCAEVSFKAIFIYFLNLKRSTAYITVLVLVNINFSLCILSFLCFCFVFHIHYHQFLILNKMYFLMRLIYIESM